MDREAVEKHLAQTPLMQPIDAIKLAYQHAFGVGHLLGEGCEAYAARELAELCPNPAVPVSEPLGGGLCRLNLAAPEVHALGAEVIAKMMRVTDAWLRSLSGSEQRYQSAVQQITAAVRAGKAPFSMAEWEACLTEHQRQGRPVVSHSAAYREAYHPHYRVVMADYALLLPVLRRIREGRSVVAIDGPCGGGKTTLAKLLAALYGAQPISMDDFFLPFELRTPERFRQVGGNIHFERFRAEVLEPLQAGRALTYRRFDCCTGEYVPVCCKAAPVAIIEGSYSHHPAFEESYARLNALRVFVDVDEQEQLRRIRRRSPELYERFCTEWIPLEKTYFEAYDRRKQAELLLVSRPWNA